MNKREAIKCIEQMGEYERFVDEPISKKSVLNIISQIAEPQKVVVPKFVADWIEKHKQEQWWLGAALTDREDDKFREWMVLCDMDTRIINQETFARAWIFGYEIEQEKMYTVEIPNPNRSGKGHAKFRLEKIGNKVVLVKRKSKECYQNKPNQKLTESEIK
ncbi:TPA: DUF1642 domain-containing protein, partial [Streptococcus suis]|nr:DUF1642 domain-containing protein [Streptococcus suis]